MACYIFEVSRGINTVAMQFAFTYVFTATIAQNFCIAVRRTRGTKPYSQSKKIIKYIYMDEAIVQNKMYRSTFF